MLVCLDYSKDVHDSDWEFVISSNSIVDFKSCLFIHDGEGDFAASESQIKSLSTWYMVYLMMMERGKHSLSLWGPWLGLVALMPPILDNNQDLGVLILFKCFLGPLAIDGLFNI